MAIVDDDNYDEVMKYKWHLSNSGYCVTKDITGQDVEMGAFVMFLAETKNN